MVGTLEFKAGSRVVRTATLERGQSLVIGRASDADVAFENLILLCRRHCRVWEENGQVRIEDLKTPCGTYVNRRRVPRGCELKDGDEVQLPEVSFVFRMHLTEPG